MNLLYFTHYSLSNNKFKGIKNKIQSQIDVFEKNNLNSFFVFFEELKMISTYKDKTEVLFTFKNNTEKRLKMYDVLNDHIAKNKINVLYIRYPSIEPKFISFLKYNKSKKIFLEVPTYPFKNEDKSLKAKLIRTIEFFNKFKLKNSIDYVVTFSNHKKIFGVSCININNGIDVSKFPLIKKKKNNDKTLNLIGVANVSRWHGYDRIIRGLYEYYKTTPSKEVFFHIVGEGNELTNLKKLTQELNLNHHVIFHGYKTGKELNELFNLADVGIGSLGNHRKDLLKESALKNREYCVRGLPFVISSKDDDFSSNFKYVYHISKNDSPIKIEKIINFYASIKNKNYSQEMRSYAEKNLTWEAKMQPIVDVILGEKNEIK